MTKFDTLKENDKLSEAQFYSVVKKTDKQVQLRNDAGELIVVDKEYVEKCLTSANQFEEEKSITKTEAASLFLGAANVVMTVNFNKQVKEKEAREELYKLYANKGGTVISEAEYKKRVNSAVASILVGEERTMVGRHFGEQNELGRVHFIDMEIVKTIGEEYDNRLRQVDPRTINWLIIRGVKYKVK